VHPPAGHGSENRKEPRFSVLDCGENDRGRADLKDHGSSIPSSYRLRGRNQSIEDFSARANQLSHENGRMLVEIHFAAILS
jgi:hypothetical protein